MDRQGPGKGDRVDLIENEGYKFVFIKRTFTLEVLDTVSLNHIVTREGGWDTAADWKVGRTM